MEEIDMTKMKGLSMPGAIIVSALLIVGSIVVVFGGLSFSVQQEQNDDLIQGLTTAGFGGYDFEMNLVAKDGSTAQDSEADYDIDIFRWDESKNSDLANDYYLDCSGATPVTFDGDKTQYDVPESAFCEINPYKWWQNTNFNAGDSETKIDDHLSLEKADLKDVDDGTESNYMWHLAASQTYLVTYTEGAATDNEDVIPGAFLVTSASKSSTFTDGQLDDGSVNIRFTVSYYSDATDSAHARFKVDGVAEDSENNENDLSSSLGGLVDSSLTTATSVNYDGTVVVEVTRDGYGIILKNPLAQSATEKPYLTVTPYGEGTNGTAFPSSSAAWEEYGTGDLSGDVGYGTTVQATNDQIIWQDFSFCGESISDSSTSDSVKKGDEKLYEPSCFVNAATKKNGVWGIWDDDSKIEMTWSISSLTVDYDSAVNATNGALDYASGSSPEVIADIDAFSVHDTTSDFVAQTLG
jgi:hypothetical protein